MEDDMSNNENDFSADDRHYVEGIGRLGQEVAQLIRDAQLRRFEDDLGHPIAHLVAHPEIVEAFADHPDPERRCTALTFFVYYTPLHTARERLLTAVKSDPASSVRQTSASLMGTVYLNTGDREVLEMLKDVAHDGREDDEVRRTAYLSVAGIDREGNLIDRDTFDFPDDADWEFFDRVVPDYDPEGGLMKSVRPPV
jgi:hypothetical protein